MLLLLMLLPVVFSKDTSVDKNFIIKRIDSCPEEGYYFRRELAHNSATPGPCYLCFCQTDGTAICWRRENRRCDVENYHYHNVGKRDARVRRGIGLGDIFFRDAARDLFNKQLPEQCKPYESSFSDGCPPADWCIGCTVCDCDANGHWDCHVLSYCPNKSNKKPLKTRKGKLRRTVIRKSVKRPIKSTTKNLAKSKSKPTSIHNKNPQINVAYKPIIKNRQKRQPVKNQNQGQKKKFIQRRNQPPRRIVKKYIAKKPMTSRTNSTKKNLLPVTQKLAQDAARKIMAAVRKMMKNDLKKGDSSKILKAVDKGSPANINNNKKGSIQNINQSKSTTKKYIGQINKARNKRETNLDIERSFELNATGSLPKESLFVEEVVMRNGTNDTTVLQSIATTRRSFKIITNTTSTTRPVNIDLKYVIPKTTTPMTIILNDPYYKYLKNGNTTLTTTNQPTQKIFSKDLNLTANQNELHKTTTAKLSNFIINVTDINEDKEEKQGRMIYLIDKIPSANDLKFKKWSQIKLLKDKAKHFKVELVKSKNLDNVFDDKSAKVGEAKKKSSLKHQVKKIGVSKKYNVQKLVNTSKMRKNEKITTNKTNIFFINNKITQLQTFVKNLLNGFGRNNTNKSDRQSKQFNVIRYMRNFFRKIFHSSTKKILKNEKRFILNNHVIGTLCEHFGPCKINRKQKKLLEIKLKDIHYETIKILKIINIIKGLLHLIELPSSENVNLNKAKSSFNDDILKLNSILKDTYQKPLSETNSIQIEYIKKNTQEFVQSIGNFATLLNEIILILTKTKKKYTYSQRPISVPAERKSNKNEAFTYIKNLLMKYDIIHNTFLRRMYDTITAFESKLNQDKLGKVNMKEDLNNTASINNYSNNIIENLRKLKNLAQVLSSKRHKREVTKDDDAIEYLLILMEYLLKQNYPVNAAPVSDGIDLLLESIKHSPDIKSIKKKVLEYLPLRNFETVTPLRVDKLEKSDSNVTSTENDSKSESNSTSKLDDTKLTEELEEDRDYDDKYIITKKSTDIITKSAVYRSNIKSNGIKGDIDSTTHKDILENKKANKFEIKKTIFDSIEERFGETDNSSKYEIYNADLDDENQVTETSTTEPTTEISIVADKLTLETKVKSEQDSSASEITKLDWVDKEAKDYKEYSTSIQTKSTTSSTTKAKATHKIIEDNVSIISKELKAEGKKKKINIKEVMHKKQMDLLNSLDYGTEKTNTEDESKDVSVDEKYTLETFPAYFV